VGSFSEAASRAQDLYKNWATTDKLVLRTAEVSPSSTILRKSYEMRSLSHHEVTVSTRAVASTYRWSLHLQLRACQGDFSRSSFVTTIRSLWEITVVKKSRRLYIDTAAQVA